MDPSYEQLSLFENKPIPDPRPPETVTWNGIHGCRKVSPGCLHCYMFRRDESVGKDPTIVRKTQSFNLPAPCGSLQRTLQDPLRLAYIHLLLVRLFP